MSVMPWGLVDMTAHGGQLDPTPGVQIVRCGGGCGLLPEWAALQDIAIAKCESSVR